MQQRLKETAALAILMTTLGACKMIEQLKKTGEAVAAGSAVAQAGASAPSSQDEKDSELNEKLEGYIYCMNYETRSAFRAKEGYLRDVDENKGPTGKESNIYVSELSSDTCLKRIDESKAKPPAMADLDAAATDYKTTLAELEKQTKVAHQYYDQKDFKDDKFAKGIALHKPLMAAFAAFEKANKVFEDKVTSLNDAIGQRRLARLKNDPKAQLEYTIAKSVDDAKKLVHFAEVESLEKVDAAGLTAALATYEQSLGAFNTYADGHGAEADKVMMLSRFKSTSADFLKSAKELMRRKRDNKGFKGEILSPEMIDGHPANVLAKYNDMINSSNDLRFR
jgi:hypothetical protein